MSNYLEGVFQPAYSFDNVLGFQTRLDTSLNGNVTIGNINTNYGLLLNGLPVGGGSGVASVNGGIGAVSIVGTGGTTVSTIGSTVTVNSTAGVASVTAGTGITIGGTATIPVVNNTGVLSVTAGTNVTIGGTASNPVINSTGGVASVTAGTGITIGGTATTPIISASAGPSVTGYWSYLAGGSFDQTINENVTLGSGTFVQWSNILYQSTPSIANSGPLINTTWTAPYNGWYQITLNLEGRNVASPGNVGSTVMCYNTTIGQQINTPIRFIPPSSGQYTTSATYMTSLNLNDALIWMGGTSSPPDNSREATVSPISGLNIHLLEAL